MAFKTAPAVLHMNFTIVCLREKTQTQQGLWAPSPVLVVLLPPHCQTSLAKFTRVDPPGSQVTASKCFANVLQDRDSPLVTAEGIKDAL